MADTLDRLKTALADRYAINHELGAGGMATVYLAEDPSSIWTSSQMASSTSSVASGRDPSPPQSGRLNTYRAFPLFGCVISFDTSLGTLRGLDPPSAVVTAIYCLPSIANETGCPWRRMVTLYRYPIRG